MKIISRSDFVCFISGSLLHTNNTENMSNIIPHMKNTWSFRFIKCKRYCRCLEKEPGQLVESLTRLTWVKASARSFWLIPQRLATLVWHLWWMFILHSEQRELVTLDIKNRERDKDIVKQREKQIRDKHQ